jgi:hypothetical protein
MALHYQPAWNKNPQGTTDWSRRSVAAYASPDWLCVELRFVFSFFSYDFHHSTKES